jgi:ATP-dependent DNA helicase RecG
MERTDLDLGDVMLLDRVQKGQGISRDEHRRLKAAGLVEGRYPSLIVAGAVAKAAGEAARHIRERGFDQQYYLDLILALAREHGPVGREEIDQLLLAKLPDRLTAEQKRRKISNLLQKLRRAGSVQNRGTRHRPAWVLAAPNGEEGTP